MAPRKKSLRTKAAPKKPVEKPSEGPLPDDLTEMPPSSGAVGKTADDVIKEVQKHHGKEALFKGAEYTPQFYMRWPTGILALDFAFKGGWPRGTYCSIAGPEGIGKTAIAFQTVAELQRHYGEDASCAYITLAGEMDRVLAAVNGVQIELSENEKQIFADLTGREPPNGTVGTLVTQGVIGNEKRTEAVLDQALNLTQSGKFQLIILDEIGGGQSQDMRERTLTKGFKPGSEAKLLTSWGQKLLEKLGRNKLHPKGNPTTVLGVCQIRSLMMDPEGYVKYKTAEPHCLKHAAGVRLHLTPVSILRNKDTKEVTGKKVNWVNVKGRHGIVEATNGSMIVNMRDGVNLVADTIDVGKRCGLISNSGGSWFNVAVGGEGHRINGDRGLIELLRGDESLHRRLRAEIRELGLIGKRGQNEG